MLQKIFILSSMAIILAVTPSCSKNDANDALPVVGSADLNGRKMELTFSHLGRVEIPYLPGIPQPYPTQYVFMLAGGMNAKGKLTQEPLLLGFINTLPESGSQITFDLNKDAISLNCTFKNKTYSQPAVIVLPPVSEGTIYKDMNDQFEYEGNTLPIDSGTLTLQRTLNDVFYLVFEIHTEDKNILSGTAKLNWSL